MDFTSDNELFLPTEEVKSKTDDRNSSYDVFFPSDEDEFFNDTIEELPLNHMQPADIGLYN